MWNLRCSNERINWTDIGSALVKTVRLPDYQCMFYRSYLRPIRQNLAANATDRTVGCRIGTSRSLPERCQIEIADNVPDMIANIC